MSRHTTMRQMSGLVELRTAPLYKAVAAEFLGTAILVMASCGAGVYSSTNNFPAGAVILPAFVTGLTLATLIQSIGHVSGGHVNPAVTLGLLVARYTSLARAVLYIVAQLIGSVAGVAVLYGIVPKSYQSLLGVLKKNDDITEAQAFGTEVIITFVLIFIIVSVSDEHRTDIKGSAPLAIGISVVTFHLFAIPLSGACMNPARAFGPAVIVGSWSYHWVYWTGPLLGGVLASLTYTFLFRAPKPPAGDRLIIDAHRNSSGIRY